MMSIFIFSLAITFVDTFIHPNYFIKIFIKMILFLSIPMLFFVKNKQDFEIFKKLFKFKKEKILKTFLMGFSVYIVILGCYFLTKNIIDFSNVTTSLTNGMGITKQNFLYVSLYISILNSFLEEFFFRGYGFITLKQYISRKNAYIFSSFMFALYHIGMLKDMFSLNALIILLFGLIICGCIFDYLNEIRNNIYSSWIVHMFANFGINTIGFILFNII